jgi:thiol:disulfide interchange protein DsbC
MLMKRLAAVFVLIPGLYLTTATAADNAADTAIRTAIRKILPNATIDEINPSPINGMSEVIMGSELYYASNDGRYIIQGGSLIDMNTRIDLSEERLKGIRHRLLSKVDQKDEIIFPASKERHVITVFTDIDCGYCRKLHKEINEYNKLGISVRYLSFPRTGLNSPSYLKAESVWCSKDRNDALTRAKAGENLPPGKCDNPVRRELELGQQLGVNGTPAIFLEDGTLLPGYVPAAKLAAELDRMKSM